MYIDVVRLVFSLFIQQNEINIFPREIKQAIRKVL